VLRYKELEDLFEAVINMRKPFSLTVSLVLCMFINNSIDKQILMYKNIGEHLPSLFPPFQVKECK